MKLVFGHFLYVLFSLVVVLSVVLKRSSSLMSHPESFIIRQMKCHSSGYDFNDIFCTLVSSYRS